MYTHYDILTHLKEIAHKIRQTVSHKVLSIINDVGL